MVGHLQKPTARPNCCVARACDACGRATPRVARPLRGWRGHYGARNPRGVCATQHNAVRRAGSCHAVPLKNSPGPSLVKRGKQGREGKEGEAKKGRQKGGIKERKVKRGKPDTKRETPRAATPLPFTKGGRNCNARAETLARTALLPFSTDKGSSQEYSSPLRKGRLGGVLGTVHESLVDLQFRSHESLPKCSFWRGAR